ncbi:MAG: protein kinase [Verrucomicrobia bacterium]|nr:protein kinase [Verrucomicrobiota bacterium]OQC67755.1 MAG: Serine/threonine-protein kinase StkP [Verrucomicrobia bacterium ADurb.Bin006]MDI9382466.1 protein kinase [Verrucomicrobiota bacterium]NMD19031.1 protein kinase [Verrucomicrobiota bacterium]HOA60962.1 protein kinase [Verrucomicrobiota bacterium]
MMSEPEQPSSPRRCAQCGAELPRNVPADLCPKCLLRTGLDTQPIAAGNATVIDPEQPRSARGLPQPGEQLGHYQIVRRLGEGGMGAVYEAEDLENGRRVALKVLSHTLDSPEARERFFREGRLAASINHPNSVYVFGTEEIGGTPVIAMERVAGGTLQERVQAEGPLPVGRAVDAVLEVIAGLDAAQRIGVLHRDVKPSNCFVDADGTVKIGDFGLSISTAIRTEPALTATRMFLGTPAFCSPEQLRGDELNARSDLYSVGATLFYLLTGHTPFEGKNAVQLLATVLEQRAPSVRTHRPNIPHGLGQVISRCLEKLPGDRFRSYDELRQALAPYSSTAPTPATMGFRFLAGGLDLLILNLVFLAVVVPLSGSPMEFLNQTYHRSPRTLAVLVGFGVLSVLYYALFESLRGSSPGKALCRLRVIGPDRGTPGFGRALGRALCYVVLPPLPFWLVYGPDPTAYLNAASPIRHLMGFSFYIVLGLLFCTVRRSNGFAAVHDLLTRTRVVSRLALRARPTLAAQTPSTETVSGPAVGPYRVIETLETSGDAAWLLGYDLRLLRKVWVRKVPPGTSPMPPHLRNLGRVGRLRWIAGRRAPEENWDAFEAPAGQPLVSLIEEPQTWDRVRFWLHDLASEISASEKDGTLPAVLGLDRVWITDAGRAKLLDFSAPGALSTANRGDAFASCDPEAPANRQTEARNFLGQVARAALEWSSSTLRGDAHGGHEPEERRHRVPGLDGERGVPPAERSMGRAGTTGPGESCVAVPLPLHARKFLEAFGELASAEAIVTAIAPLLSRVTAVSRARRLGVVAACAAVPLFMALGMMFGLEMLDRMNRAQPGVVQLNALLAQRAAMRFPWMKSASGPDDRLIAIYIAEHFRSTITNTETWSSPFVASMITIENRRFAERSVLEHPHPPAQEVEEAERALKPYVEASSSAGILEERWFPFMVFLVGLCVYVGLPALVCALAFRGGLVLRALGVAIVRHDGAPASRLRVFWRGLMAWSPVLLAPLLFGMLRGPLGPFGAAVLSSLLAIGLTALSLAHPQRNLQDRFAGTWLVPR